MLHINKKLARALSTFGLVAMIGLAAGCGGGGGGGGTSGTSGNGSTTGGGSTSAPTSGGTSGRVSVITGGAVSSTPASLAGNQVAVVVSSATGVANIPMVSVKICQPNTTNCATINNVQLDTGSYGLRLTASAVNAASATLLGVLPTETVNGQAVAECMGFADGYTWGSVRTADVRLNGEAASNININILGDLAQSAAGGTNNACASGTLNNTPSRLAANGILGIGTARYDCGSGCLGSNSMYFGCTTSGGATSCTNLPLSSLTQEVSNPVRSFTLDNNGVVLNMPSVGSSGSAVSASGVLTFGLGTQSNNGVPPSGIQTFTTDHYGDVSRASVGGITYTDTSQYERAAFFDTGSNGLFFPAGNTGLSYCTDMAAAFYCPSSALALQPSVVGFNGATAPISISIQNADALYSSGGYAFNNLGGDGGMSAIDFGMPFFYGRTVYLNYDTATDGTLNAGTSAYVAF